MKFSIAPEPKNGLPLALIAGLTAVILIAISFAGLAQSASAAPIKGNKIVALTPFSANAMGTMGVMPRAVGEVLNTSDTAASFVPAIESGIRGRRIDQLLLTHPNGPNLEKLAKLNPKLVFTSPQWSKGTSAMQSLGIKVKKSEPITLGGIYSEFKKVAKVIGKQKAAKRYIAKTKAKVKKATAGIGARKRVMVILGVGRTPFAFLNNSWGGEIVKRSGGNLLTGGASNSSGFARISDEVVIAADPEVIIAVPHAIKNDIEGLIEYMKTNPAWQETTAVDNEDLYVSTDNSLLQAGVDPAKVIRTIRSQYLKNN
ncbi:MAG TPA: ABC transporter substrate-binding protein [Solirubrobacterales bacterium]|nr:ABC transporter substrate-binding protein [Solirubrobacterales bacterium]